MTTPDVDHEQITITAPHECETGHRETHYDSDGAGHLVWVCDECGAVYHDDMP